MQIYITDKNGKRHWNTHVSAGWAAGERNNIARHLAAIKLNDPAYAACGIDPATAKMVEELDKDEIELTDDELLAALAE
jgi:hypothetical protein